MSYVLEHNLFNSHYLLFEVKKTKHITLVSGQDICQYHTSIRVGYLSVSHQYQSRIFVSITLVSEQDIRVGYLSVSHQYQSRIFVSITLVSEQDIRVGYLPVSHWYKVSIEQVLSEVYFRYKFQMLLMLEQNSMQQWSTINKLLCFIYHI